MTFKTILGIITFALCFAFADFLGIHILNRHDIGGLIQLASTLIVFQTIFMTVNATFVGLDKTEYNAATTLVLAVVKAVAAPVLVILGLSIVGALLGYVFSYAVAVLLGISLFIFRIYRPLNNSDDDPASFRENLRMLIAYGLPLYLSILITGFALQYRNIIMAVFTSDYEIGNFQAAMNFNLIVSSISMPVATMLLPAFSKLEERKESLTEFFKLALKYTSMMILPITILLMVYSKEIVQIIYGGSYELAPSFLSLFLVTYFLVGLGFNILGSFFNGIGQTKVSLRIAIVNSAILVVLAPLLTWSLGVYGMIIAILLSSTTGTIYSLYTAKKSFKIQIDTRTIAKIYLVSSVSALPLLVVRGIPLNSSIIKIAVGAAAYFGLYLLMVPMAKLITVTELEEIKKVLEKIRPLKYLAKPFIYYEEKIMLRNS